MPQYAVQDREPPPLLEYAIQGVEPVASLRVLQCRQVGGFELPATFSGERDTDDGRAALQPSLWRTGIDITSFRAGDPTRRPRNPLRSDEVADAAADVVVALRCRVAEAADEATAGHVGQ